MRGPAYLAAWATACVIAIVLAIRTRRGVVLFSKAYARSLLRTWKLVLFSLAFAVFVLGAPYSGDPTWDRVDATFMSVLAFGTAPWAVGVIYRALRGRASFSQAYLAIVVWLFSASWSYDLYILLRDGFYPRTWWSNAIASSVLYAAAGLLFSLDVRASGGATFSFLEPTWPDVPARRGMRRILAYAAAFVVLVGAMMAPFFWDALRERLR